MTKRFKRSLGISLLLAALFAGLALFLYLPHVHAYNVPISPGDHFEGVCPVCGGNEASIADIISQPTCTSGTHVWVYCNTIVGSVGEADIPALGHNYVLISSVEPTCTSAGSRSYSCSRCGAATSESLAALGHKYVSKVINEATCTEDGLTKYTCSRCGNSYEKTVEALGHEWGEEETVEATCTEDGHRRKECERCGEIEEETYPALGHSLGTFTVVKAETCTEDGTREAVCSRCGEKVRKSIHALGHEYPEEWTLEKAATYFAEGLESKTCSRCGDRITQTIPKKNIVPIIAGGAGGIAVLGGLWYFLRKKLRRKVAEEVAKELFKPSVESRTVVISSQNEGLVKSLKGKTFLQVNACDEEGLAESVADNGPDLVILDPCDENTLKRLPELKEELQAQEETEESADPGTAASGQEASDAKTAGETESPSSTEEEEEPAELVFGLILEKDTIERNRDLLRTYKEDGLISGYTDTESGNYVVLTKLVLPVLKPKAGSDESLDNIGSIADLLGIPVISTVLSAYTSGRDIKAVLDEGDIGVSETATIIGDIASILGLDTLGSVVGLVGDVESIRDAADEEAGAYERKEGVSGAKDIVEVVTDLLDK